jgi:hypothetical protein
MRRSARLISSTLLAFSLLSLLAPVANAQVSDADREAARSLYKEGFELQQAGNYADALDRFKRSQQVFPAPTALLHIAECEARLGRLVESAETYRTLEHLSLPPNSPPAFVQAQQQGAAELQQVEPRIPHVRIQVTPQNIPGLVVFVDEVPMNPALLGVDRPANPGDHKMTAQAPGFPRVEMMVHITEGQPTALVTLPLRAGPTGMVAPVPYGAQPYPVQQYPAPPVVYVQPGYVPPRGFGQTAPPVTPVVVETPPESRKGLFFGPRVGGVYPAVGNNLSGIGAGVSLGLEADFRFARRLFLGAVVDHGFLSTSDAFSGATAGTTNFDVVFGVLTNPDKFGGIFQVGLGYRVLSVSAPSVAAELGGVTPSVSINSVDGTLGAGLWIPIGSHFRLVPRVDASFGSFSDDGGGYAMIAFVLGAYPNFNF